jgi:hypothetical protein
MKLNWTRIGKEITPHGWKVVASRPDSEGWEFCWETGYGGDFAFSAIVITYQDVKAIGRKNVSRHFRGQLDEHDRDMKAGGRETRRHQELLEKGIVYARAAREARAFPVVEEPARAPGDA